MSLLSQLGRNLPVLLRNLMFKISCDTYRMNSKHYYEEKREEQACPKNLKRHSESAMHEWRFKDGLESVKQNRVTEVNPTKETIDLSVRSLAEIIHIYGTTRSV